MSDSTTPFGTIAIGQQDQVTLANALFDALSPASLYAIHRFNTSGMSLGLHGGKIILAGVLTVVADQQATIVASSTNYVQADPTTGTVSVNQSGYTQGFWHIGRAVTGTSAITTWYDDRYIGGFDPLRRLAKTLPSDANYTLTAAEARNYILEISGSITAQRIIYLPAIPCLYAVFNNTTYPLNFAAGSGGGVVVTPGQRALIYSDGTNFNRVADATVTYNAPVTKTGNFTLATSESEIICNGGASITATLPAAGTCSGRRVRIKTRAAYTVVSASSNVKPLDTDTAGTAILAATAGKWAELVSDGTNWVIMAGN